MGKLYKPTHYLLGLLCASAFAVQALAADRPSVTIDANTGRVTTTPQTYQVPRGATLNVQQTNLPVTMSQGTMNVPVSSRVNPPSGRGFDARSLFKVNTPALRNSLYRCLTCFRCNMAAQAGAAGFGAFMDGLDWVMTEGATGQPMLEIKGGDCSGCSAPTIEQPPGSVSILRCLWQYPQYPNNPCSGYLVNSVSTGATGFNNRYCPESLNGRPFIGPGAYGETCYYGSSPDTPAFDPNWSKLPDLPATPDDILDALPGYQPQASDWPFLSGGVDLADDGITIEGDFLELPEPEVTTENLSNGTSRRTTTTVEPEWYDNPSSQPGIEFTTYTEVTIFNEYGDIVSNETSSITSGRGGGGGGSAGPIDCEFMPTVCRFINWFTEPDPEMLEEPDLKQLMETFDPDESSYDFGPDTMACPEPYTIAFSLLPSVEVSLQPICDVVDRVRPLVLALAYIFAGILLVRNI